MPVFFEYSLIKARSTAGAEKRLIWSIVGIFILALGAFNYGGVLTRFASSSPLKTYFEFYSLLNRSNGILDLRKIKSVDWEEFVIWTPYASICDYGIKGYEKTGDNCEPSESDVDCYLLLLNNNKLAAKIAIDREKIDLADTDIKGRVPRDRAIITYDTHQGAPMPTLVAPGEIDSAH